MRLIDADNLKPDAQWEFFYNCYFAYSISQIDDAPTVQAVPIEELQEIWNKTYGLHPINRGDNDYANGVYDGMCRVIDIVCNTIDSKIKELSE